jgi:hypothetical protein
MSCYQYEEYHFNKPLLNVDATYIIHLVGNGRYESIIDQLHKYPISKKVYIVLNQGYKKCQKDSSITKPPLDLIDAFLEIFKHAENKENILILEDDFMFDDKILDQYHQNNINKFIEKNSKSDFLYYIGALPYLLFPYDFYNYKNIASSGGHSVIYSKKIRKRILLSKKGPSDIHDWDVYLNLQPNRYIYYIPLCYQLFPDTENSNHWGDYNVVLYYLGLTAKFIIKLLDLDKSIWAYSILYFVSKLWFLLFLIIIWILLTFIISLKM